MIDLYSAATPNGQKIHIMLEECGLDFEVHWVDIDAGDQFEPDFLAMNPNNKIPALVDHEGPEGRISLLNRAQSCSISLRRPASSSPKIPIGGGKRSSG